MKMEIQAKDRQTIFDLALKTTGCPEGAFDMALRSGHALSDTLDDGEILLYDSIADARVAERYHSACIDPATAPDGEPVCMGGIGYMCVEIDFCVS